MPPSKTSRAYGAVDLLIIAALAGIFGILEFSHLRHPGLYGDEAWGAVPSVRFALGRDFIDGGPFRQFTLFDHAFPFMANYYTGPIKTYILALGFRLFGISVETLRVTMGLVGFLAVVGLFLALRKEFGRVAATGAALLLATDLTYVLVVRGDWPPFAFAAVARTFALFFLIAWWRRGGHRALLFAGTFALGLGLTHKADFLSSVVAVSFVGVVMSFGERRIGWREALTAGAGLLAGAWPIVVFNVLSGGLTFKEGDAVAKSFDRHFLPTGLDDVPRFLAEQIGNAQTRLATLNDVLSGTFVPNWQLVWQIGDGRIGGLPPITWVFVASVLCLLVCYGLRTAAVGSWRVATFLALVLVLIFGLTVITPIAVGPHHIMAVYPLPHALIGIALGAVWAGARKRSIRIVPALGFSALVGLVVVNNLNLAHGYYDHLLAKGAKGFWSESIFELPKALESRKFDRAVVLDWSIEHPLIVLGKDSIPMAIPMWNLSAHGADDEFYRLLEGDNVFIARPASSSIDPKIRAAFEQAYRSRGYVAEEQVIRRKDGEASLSVIRLSRPGT